MPATPADAAPAPAPPSAPKSNEDEFHPPDAETRAAAVGDLDEVAALRPAFAPDSPLFQAIPAPGPSDWLAQHDEPGQTYDRFVYSEPNRVTKQRRTIYILPIGKSISRHPMLPHIVRFTRAFYGLPVAVMKPRPLSEFEDEAREAPFGPHRQLLTEEVMTKIRPGVPKDAYCVIALTLEDLYPDPEWNFVFGMASLDARIGVFSLARYSPEFYGEKPNPPLARERAFKIVEHEIGHMFGMQHCTHFHCIMNGSNSLEETDRSPLHLCPVCLRKLYWQIRRPPVERYRQILAAARQSGLKDHSRWLARRIRELTSFHPTPRSPPLVGEGKSSSPVRRAPPRHRRP